MLHRSVRASQRERSLTGTGSEVGAQVWKAGFHADPPAPEVNAPTDLTMLAAAAGLEGISTDGRFLLIPIFLGVTFLFFRWRANLAPPRAA